MQQGEEAAMKKPVSGRGYEVGYKKPPKKHQFLKGQSGNPRGRPKAKVTPLKTLEEQLVDELQKVITVTEGGKKRSMTKAAVVVRRAVDGAIAGDNVLLKWLLAIKKLPPPSDPNLMYWRVTPEQKLLVDEFVSDVHEVGEQPKARKL
jgi:hypothetical protein